MKCKKGRWIFSWSWLHLSLAIGHRHHLFGDILDRSILGRKQGSANNWGVVFVGNLRQILLQDLKGYDFNWRLGGGAITSPTCFACLSKGV